MKKWLVCDVDENGNVSDYGVPIITKNEDTEEMAYRLFGLQFGFTMHIQDDKTAINQYKNKYMAEVVGVS